VKPPRAASGAGNPRCPFCSRLEESTRLLVAALCRQAGGTIEVDLRELADVRPEAEVTSWDSADGRKRFFKLRAGSGVTVDVAPAGAAVAKKGG